MNLVICQESTGSGPNTHVETETLPKFELMDGVHVRGTYYAAVIENRVDFTGRIVVDVGAGSGILLLFATQAGVKHPLTFCANQEKRNEDTRTLEVITIGETAEMTLENSIAHIEQLTKSGNECEMQTEEQIHHAEINASTTSNSDNLPQNQLPL